MKIFFNCFLLIFILSGLNVFGGESISNKWGEVTCNAQMSIRLKGGKDTLKVNQPYSLSISIKNLSTNETFSVYNSIHANTASFGGASCVVISPSGKDVSPNQPDGSGSGMGLNIKPDSIVEFEFELGSICKLDEIGVYKIIIKKTRFGDKYKQCVIVSNELHIKVIPDK